MLLGTSFAHLLWPLSCTRLVLLQVAHGRTCSARVRRQLACVCALLSSIADVLTVIVGVVSDHPADKLAETKKSEQARREAHKHELQAQKSKKYEVQSSDLQ